MTEREIGEQAPEGCECCGGPNATVVVPACGGRAEMCPGCLRDDLEQAAIDAHWLALGV